MDKDKIRPKTFKAIAIRVTALVLSLWLIFMGCLTWAVATDYYRQIQDDARQMAVYNYHTHYGTDFSEDLPGYRDMIRVLRLGEGYNILHAERLLPFVLRQLPKNGYGSRDWYYGKWELLYGFESAMIFYGLDGNILMKTGNVLCFSYCTEHAWAAQTPETAGLAWIDLDAMPYGQNEINWALWGGPNSHMISRFSSPFLRLTGYWEGNQFHPVRIDRPTGLGLIQEYSPEQMAQRDSRGYLDWETVFSLEAPGDVPLTTLYSWETGGYSCESQSVSVNSVRYDSLTELLETAMDDEQWYRYRRENLYDSIIIFQGAVADDPEVGVYALAVRCWPMQYAALRLIPTYLVSLTMVAVLLLLILRSVKRNVTDPMGDLVRNLVRDVPIEPESDWREPFALETILQGQQQARRSLVNENQQLKSALDYAHHAEENRRQLVSNITHELKTPLAIIHSYAEGLQAGIAREKQDRYLETILEETESMDAMVLEMLDLSRLESGKAKLAADHFSLLALTREIGEKLAPALEARSLTLSWGYCNDCMLTADEGRISQVVTNLLTNALRYTPPGGHIWLRIFADEDSAHFQMENHAAHLPEEALEKIFETFYRMEPSRTARSTGLGLPIAKSILELHRGSISARNTWVNGVPCLEFSFTVPLT